MHLSKCAAWDSKKSRFIKHQEASGLLSSLQIKTPRSKIPVLGPLYFNGLKQFNERYILNEIVNKLFLAGDRFMPEMHLRQPRFTYRACGAFTKDKESIKNLKKQEIYEIFIKTN